MADRDLNAAVTDTHALVFHAAGGAKLGRRAARLFQRAEAGDANIYVPAAVIWETALLVRVGLIDLRRTLRVFFDDLFSNAAYQPVDLSHEQVYVADDLAFTRDPFDALIVAAARALQVPLITRDVHIAESRTVEIVW